ncbi:MAG: hypothetical protein JGK29_32900 [Microcoleus sp. PH2017_17_BER_D_A]|nr:hypothetical protein [Microcoleus sp. PH2017_17_BER_D_A]
MPSEPLFTNFFGAGATQTATQPTVSNRSEQLALTLILRWLRNQDQSTDSQFVIKPFEQTLEFRFNKWQRRYVSEIEVFQDDTVSTFPNPNLI